MPDFETVTVKEAQFRTIAGRQGRYLNEYADYIQQIPQGQAGKLRMLEQEKPLTIRRRLVVAAQALDAKLVIKRSGEDIYFWREAEAEEPRPRRGRRRRRQEEATAEETAALDQTSSELEDVKHGVPTEESPE
jgi:hypothetical protein